MEPPSTAPRVAEPASLTRLWRKTDVVDHVVSFLPTKCLAVLPTLADSFRRDHWRMLGVMMRRQGGRAAGTRAILSTLQVMGRELSHYSEDWQGEASLIRQRWRGCRGGRGGATDVDVEHNVGLSSNKTNPGLVIHRTTPHNSLFIGVVRAEIPGVDERCCLQRFRVSLYFSGNSEGTGGDGSSFRVYSTRQREVGGNANEQSYSSYHILEISVRRVATGVELIWTVAGTRVLLKSAPGGHTFSIDATLNWSTGKACVTVDGVECEQQCRFIPHPFNQLSLNADHSGTSFFGPIDVWWFQAPPPEPALMPFAPQRVL